MKPKAVVFDFFGVICANIAGDWFKQHLQKSDADFVHETMYHADLGEASEEETFTKLFSLSGVTHDIREVWLQNAIINQELVGVIRQLKKEYKVAVCTNSPSLFFRTVLKGNHLEELFDVIVVSSEVRMVKPEKEIFEHVCKELGITPTEVMFVDDTERNIETAKKLGMQTIHFKNVSQVQALLSRATLT